jgi:cation:H+ antiporter
VLLIGYGGIDLSRRFVRESYLPMLATFAVALALAWDGTIGRLDGLLLSGLYVAVSVARRERTRTLRAPLSVDLRRDAVVATGLLVLVLLAATVVLSVVGLLALGGSTVGVVTIGVAAALPELTAVVDAIRRQARNVALGTLVGSSIVNPLVGLGLGGVVSTYYVPPVVVLWDLPFKLLVGAGVLGWAWYVNDGSLTRTEGISLLGLYFAFVIGRLLLFPGQ